MRKIVIEVPDKCFDCYISDYEIGMCAIFRSHSAYKSDPCQACKDAEIKDILDEPEDNYKVFYQKKEVSK